MMFRFFSRNVPFFCPVGHCGRFSSQVPDLFAQLPDLFAQLLDLFAQLPDLFVQLPDLFVQLGELTEQLPDLEEHDNLIPHPPRIVVSLSKT